MAVIEDAGTGGAYVTIPFDVEKTFGKKRVKVKALLGGEPYQGSLARMEGPVISWVCANIFARRSANRSEMRSR